MSAMPWGMSERAATPDASTTTPPAEVIEACRRGLELLPQYQSPIAAAVKKRAEQIADGHPLSKNMMGRLRTYCDELLKQPQQDAGENVPLLLGGGTAAKAWLWPVTSKTQSVQIKRKAPSRTKHPVAKALHSSKKESKSVAVRSQKKGLMADKKTPLTAKQDRPKVAPPQQQIVKQAISATPRILSKPSPFEAKVYRDRPTQRKLQSKQTQSILKSFIKPRKPR